MAVTKVQSEFIVNDVALAGNPTTSTQSSGNNTTRIATTAFVTAAIDSLIDSAPGTLNTLDEIAAALNDDPSFTTTVNNAIATKLPLAGGTMTGSLTGTTATFTTADNLDTLSLLSTDTDDNSGPNLNMYRNSSSPADNDVIGQVKFTGRNDNTQDVVYASISGKIADASDSSEDGKLRFWTVAGGTNTETLTLSSGKVGIGEPNPAYPLAIQADGVVLRLAGTANTTRSIFFRNTTTANPAQLYSDGSLRIYTEDSSTDITLDAVGNIILDADDGGHVRIKDGGTQYASIYKSGSDAILDSTGDITLDAADRIVLSADDNGEIRLQDGASLYGQFKDDDDRLSIQGLIEDKNMLFVINDGGTPTTALQIDAANGGNATFAGTITTTGITRINAVSGNGAAAQLDLYGRNGGGYGASLIARSRIESVTAGTAYDTDLKFYTTDDSNNLDLALTIDHDQNVLIGTSVTDTGAVGFRYRKALNAISSVADGGVSAYFGRRSSDSAIVNFRKDDGLVGAISTWGGNPAVGRINCALLFNDDTNRIIPASVDSNTARDNVIDLGDPSHRFNDVWIGGGIHIGGTGSANKLDDYEEGTWTVVDESNGSLTFTVEHNRYTKVGRLVVAHARITYPSTSDTSMAKIGLPVACSGDSDNSTTGGVLTEQNIDTGKAYTASVNYSDSLVIRENGYNALTNAQLSGKILRFTITYFSA